MVWIKSVKTITPMGPRSTTTCNNWLRKYYLHCYLYYFYFLCCCGAWWFFMFWYTLTPPLFYLFFFLFFVVVFHTPALLETFAQVQRQFWFFFGVYFLFCVLLSSPAFSNICLNSASNLHTIVIVLAVQRRISFIFGMNLNCFMSANCARLVGKWRLWKLCRSVKSERRQPSEKINFGRVSRGQVNE